MQGQILAMQMGIEKLRVSIFDINNNVNDLFFQ